MKISTVKELISEIQNIDKNYCAITERRTEEIEQLNQMMNPTGRQSPSIAYDPVMFPTLYPPALAVTKLCLYIFSSNNLLSKLLRVILIFHNEQLLYL